jgi:hypothetical protein
MRAIVRWSAGIVVLSSAALGFGAASAVALDFIVPTGTDNPPNFSCTDQPESGPVSDPGVCRTDNEQWYWYMDSNGEFMLEPEDSDAATAAMAEWATETDMVRHYDDTPDFSGEGETDLIFQEGLVPAFPVSGGITWCVDKVDGTGWQCDSHYVRIRGNGVYEKWLAAHEAGHALGLTHGPQAVPQKAPDASIMGIMTQGNLPNGLGSEPKAQVNGVY